LNHVRVWLVILLSLFAVGLVPRATCQETNMIHIRAIISISDINFKEGKLTLYGLHLTVDVNKSFGVYLFAPSMYANNYWDEPSHYEDGWYSLWRQYFPNGIEMKFNLKEWVFYNEVLECGIVIGLNVTAHKDTRNIDADLNLPLKDEWDVNGTIVKVSKEEAALYTVHGMSAINSSIRNRKIREFYLLRIQVNRKPNIEKTLSWLPPIAMLCLLFASILVIWKGTLANSLRICLAVAFPSIAYLSFLTETTPPVLTSIEWFTLFDIGLCFTFTILAVLVDFIRAIKKNDLEKIPTGKSSKVTKDKKPNHFLELTEIFPDITEEELRILLDNRLRLHSQAYISGGTLIVYIVVALMAIKWFILDISSIYGIVSTVVSFLILAMLVYYMIVILRQKPLQTQKQLMEQYLEAKKLLAEKEKANRT